MPVPLRLRRRSPTGGKVVRAAILGDAELRNTEDDPRNFSLGLGDRQWRHNADSANDLTQAEVCMPILVKKLQRIFRLAGAGLGRVGIQNEADLWTWNHAHERTDVGSLRRVMEIQVGELIVQVAIEDDHIRETAQGALRTDSQGERVQTVEPQSNRSHDRGADILVAALDRHFGRPDAFVALEDGVTRPFAQRFEGRDVVPERDHVDLKARVAQAAAEVRDLRALAGAINARETDKDRSPALHD